MSDGIWTRLSFPDYVRRIQDVSDAIEHEGPEETYVYKGVCSISTSTRRGEFDALIPMFKKYRIPYDLWTEATLEQSEAEESYRPGINGDNVIFLVRAGNEAVVPLAELSGLVNDAKTADTLDKSLRDLIKEKTVVPLAEMVSPSPEHLPLLTLIDPSKMLDFVVNLSAHAVVSTHVQVKARNTEEASALAMSKVGDVEWHYNGLTDEKPTIVGCHEVPK